MGSMLCICEKSACFFGYIQMIEICFGIQILAYWFICINFLVQRIDHCFDWWKMVVECPVSNCTCTCVMCFLHGMDYD